MKEIKTREYFELLAMLKIVYSKRKRLLVIFIISFCLGLFFAFLLPKEFRANTVFTVNYSEHDSSKLGGLASLAGIDILGGTQTARIPTNLYSKVIESVSFRKKLLSSQIKIANLDSISFRTYYQDYHKDDFISKMKKYTLGLPSLAYKSHFKKSQTNKLNSQIVSISQEEKDLFDRLNDQLSIDANTLDGYIKIYFNMPEPLAAAQMALHTKNLLEKMVINYELESAKKQLEFVKCRFLEKKEEFEMAQKVLAQYKDKNTVLSSALAQTEMRKLQDDYDIKREVYLELAKQVEQAKIRVQKDTPVFSDIQEVTIPFEKHKPRRGLILIMTTLLGLILGIIYIIAQEPTSQLLSYLKKDL